MYPKKRVFFILLIASIITPACLGVPAPASKSSSSGTTTTTSNVTISLAPRQLSIEKSQLPFSLSAVPADGTPRTITTTLNDTSGSPAPGLTVSLSSDRGTTDTITPASAVTNSLGQASFQVSTSTFGAAHYTLQDLDGLISFGTSIYYSVAASIVASNLVFWLNADNLSLNANDPVSSWTDQSSSNITFTPVNGSYKATYKTSAGWTHPGVNFAGTGNLASTPLCTYISPVLSHDLISNGGVSNEHTIFVVKTDVNATVENNSNILSIYYPDGTLPSFSVYVDRSSNDKYINGGPGWSWAANNYLTQWRDISPTIELSTYERSDHTGAQFVQIRKNRSAVTTNYPTSFASGNLSISANPQACLMSNGYKGTLFEILVYNTALSSNDVDKVECYLSNKYNLSLVGC